MDGDDEILDLFLEESAEHLEGIESDLLLIEQHAENVNSEMVNKVFRAMHTIKGGSSFFGLNKIKDLTHVAEGILDKVRNNLLVPNPNIIQSILQAVDLLNEMINNPAEMDNVDISGCVKSLENELSGNSNIEPSTERNDSIPFLNKAGKEVFSLETSSLERSENMEKGGSNIYLLEFDLINDIEKENKTPLDVINDLAQLCYLIDSKVDYSNTPDLENFEKSAIPFYVLVSTVLEQDMAFEFLGLEKEKIVSYDIGGNLIEDEEGEVADLLDLSELDALSQELSAAEDSIDKTESSDKGQDFPAIKVTSGDEEISVAVRDSHEEKARGFVNKSEASPKAETPVVQAVPKPKKLKLGGTENLRVNINLLEKLMSLAGELVLARNQLLQGAENDDLDALKQSAQDVDMVTSQLQEAIMKTRMQQISIVFTKFNRIVRDLANSLKKEVNLVIEGDTVELDKSIIEKIGDPLTHIVRNSMDHGFEMPNEREKCGKDRKGTLLIKAYHEAGKVVIDIIDDGAGIDPEKVGAKALEKGLITEKDMERMSEKELCNLIFKPGFSTAEQVTEISGRGVGMDVVMTNLTALNGVVDLTSKKGEGTRLKVSIPLTLAIMPSLLVSINNHPYAVPQVNLLQILRIPLQDIAEKIQHIGTSLVTRFMDELIPVVRGKDFIESDPKPIDFKAKNYGFSEAAQILVVASGEKRFGIMIDMTLDSPEIVVKPFGNHLRGLPIYAGATILGDGSIAPILDVTGIMNVLEIDNVYFEEEETQTTDDSEELGEVQNLLIVTNGHDENFAVPLSNIIRIEKLAPSQIENVGALRTGEFLGKSTGLFTIDDTADVGPVDLKNSCSVILFEMLGKTLGLIVKEIIDSVEVAVEFDEQTYKQPGILGAAYINNNLTLLVDLFGIVSKKMPQWVEDKGIHLNDQEKIEASKVLIIDDSQFFLNQIDSFLLEAGYQTVTAMNGQEALDILHEPDCDVSFVLTDIEMPVMDGWELITAIRSDSKLKHIPIVAVTSVAGEQNIIKGKDLGADAYLLKLDREEILQTIKHFNTLQIV